MLYQVSHRTPLDKDLIPNMRASGKVVVFSVVVILIIRKMSNINGFTCTCLTHTVHTLQVHLKTNNSNN